MKDVIKAEAGEEAAESTEKEALQMMMTMMKIDKCDFDILVQRLYSINVYLVMKMIMQQLF